MADDPATLAALGAAVTGPGTPDRAHYVRPSQAAMGWQGFALIASVGLAFMIASVLAFGPRPASIEVWKQRDFYLGVGLLASIATIAFTALAMSWRQVSAGFGGGEVKLGDGP